MRTEKKFLLTYGEYQALRSRLGQILRRDTHADASARYPVYSLYYDTFENDFFYQKIEGEFDHVKIRLRQYSAKFDYRRPLFVEAKVKLNESQFKVRIHHQGLSSLNPAHWELDDDYMNGLFWQTTLAPVCAVYYEREVYDGCFGSAKVRLNFDTNILFLYPYEYEVTEQLLQERQMLREAYAVLEIKQEGADLFADVFNQLKIIPVERVSYSKYANAMLYIDNAMGLEG